MSADLELQALLGEVVATVDEEIAADPGCPDFAAMIARAHELDPQRVRAEAVAEVNQWAPVVSIQQGHRRRRTRDDEELQAVIEGVRSEVEQEVAQRLGTPPLRTSTEPSVRGRRVWGLVLAAAAVLLIVGAGVLQAGSWRLQRDDPSRNEAVHVSPGPSSEPSQEVAPSSRRSPSSQPAEDAAPVEVMQDDAPAEVIEDAEPAVPTRAARSGRKSGRTPPPTLEELDAMAHAAWRAGDLPEAERLFRVLAKRAGKGRLGDLAYGDLFTLARQRKEPGKEAKLWREYLRRFPDGRFADDARAGLCRRQSGEAQRTCWERYLEDEPAGAHRAQAKRAIEAAGDAP